MKRKLLPLQVWDTLIINKVYLIKCMHELETDLKSVKK